jgi:hypothetical protein
MRPQISIDDLIAAMHLFKAYDGVEVFADDVRELNELSQSHSDLPAGWRLVGERTIRIEARGERWMLDLDEARGVARLSPARTPEAPAGKDATVAGAALGAIIGGAIGKAASEKGEHFIPGLLLGMLFGALAGQPATPKAPAEAPPPRRIFTLRFDAKEHRWRAYDGGLVPWMTQKLLPAA